MGLFNSNSLNEVQKGVNALTRLALKHKASKTPQLGYSYPDFYYHMFSGKTDKVKKVLQIGLGDREKNSLYFWRDFFPKAKVYGIGSDKKFVYKRGRIQTFICARTDTPGLNDLIKKIGGDIDLVVDEGKRDPKDIISSLHAVMPLVQKDITYVIENTDRQQAAAITNDLRNYNYSYKVLRHHKMVSSFDRLIVVTKKTA